MVMGDKPTLVYLPKRDYLVIGTSPLHQINQLEIIRRHSHLFNPQEGLLGDKNKLSPQ